MCIKWHNFITKCVFACTEKIQEDKNVEDSYL